VADPLYKPFISRDEVPNHSPTQILGSAPEFVWAFPFFGSAVTPFTSQFGQPASQRAANPQTEQPANPPLCHNRNHNLNPPHIIPNIIQKTPNTYKSFLLSQPHQKNTSSLLEISPSYEKKCPPT